MAHETSRRPLIADLFYVVSVLTIGVGIYLSFSFLPLGVPWVPGQDPVERLVPLKWQIGAAVLVSSLIGALVWAGFGKIIHVLSEIRDRMPSLAGGH